MNSLNGRAPKPGTDSCGTCGRKDLKCRVGGTGKKVMPFHRALCGKACIGGPVAREERVELGIHDVFCLCWDGGEKAAGGRG